jgi:hypothetical protein
MPPQVFVLIDPSPLQVVTCPPLQTVSTLMPQAPDPLHVPVRQATLAQSSRSSWPGPSFLQVPLTHVWQVLHWLLLQHWAQVSPQRRLLGQSKSHRPELHRARPPGGTVQAAHRLPHELGLVSLLHELLSHE